MPQDAETPIFPMITEEMLDDVFADLVAPDDGFTQWFIAERLRRGATEDWDRRLKFTWWARPGRQSDTLKFGFSTPALSWRLQDGQYSSEPSAIRGLPPDPPRTPIAPLEENEG